MLYENQADRDQQTIAAHQLERHLKALGMPVALTETPEKRRMCYDYVMGLHPTDENPGGLWHGVVEVKCRKLYSTKIEEWGTIPIESERMRSLSKLFLKKNSITGEWFWDKAVLFLFRCTIDDVCYIANGDVLLEHWKSFEDAPASMLKEDHGNGLKDCTGKLVPIDLMEKIT